MNREEYKKLLSRSEWKKKSLEIKRRDSFECRGCGSNKHLEVHHDYYIEGWMPWQYPEESLVTLCSSCHEKVHLERPIQSFFQNAPKDPKRIANKVAKKKKKKKEKVAYLMTSKDRQLQDRYDKLNLPAPKPTETATKPFTPAISKERAKRLKKINNKSC